MRIAIIHYHWYLQIHGKQLINALAKKGIKVDAYFIDMIEMYESLDFHENVTVYERKMNYAPLRILSEFLQRIYGKLAFSRKIICLFFEIILQIRKSIISPGKKYDLCIGIDCGGGLIAQKFSQKSGCPYIYYSLEILDQEDFGYGLFLGTIYKKSLVCMENAAAVIIQDRSRAEFLSRFIQIKKYIFLPVSVKKSNIRAVREEKICLVFGNNHFLQEEDIVLLSRSIPKNWKILFHNTNLSLEKKVIAKHDLRNIIISESVLSQNEIEDLIASSFVGLAFYGSWSENEKRIIFSSEKVARYLSHGIPIITNTFGNANVLFSEILCGIAVENIMHIPNAIKKIEENYDKFSSNAFLAFERYYNFDTNFQKIYPELLDIIKTKTQDQSCAC